MKDQKDHAITELVKALDELNKFLVKNVNPDVIRKDPKTHVKALKLIGQHGTN